MSRQKGKRNIPQEVIDEIIRLHTVDGLSKRQLSEQFKMPFKTIGNMITRENNKKKQVLKGEVIRRPGRPKTRSPSTEQELLLRVKQLECEVELYRSFLQAAGRM